MKTTVKYSLIYSAVILLMLFLATKSLFFDFLVAPCLLGVLYALVFNKNKAVPSFDPAEKPLKRFCVVRVLIFAVLIQVFNTTRYICEAKFDSYAGLVCASIVIVECFTIYLLFVNRKTTIFKNAKSILAVSIIALAVSAIAGVFFHDLIVKYNDIMHSNSNGTGNMMNIMGSLSLAIEAEKYRTLAYYVLMVQKWIIMSAFVFFHPKQAVTDENVEQ